MKAASAARRLGHGGAKLRPVSLDYASEHLRAAVKSLATSEEPLIQRLQSAWDDHVQMLWMKPCLPADLLVAFREQWQRYTAPSDDRTSTKLRHLERGEAEDCVDQLVDLWGRVEAVAAQASGDVVLVTLADLE